MIESYICAHELSNLLVVKKPLEAQKSLPSYSFSSTRLIKFNSIIYILNDSSNITNRIFAIFSKLYKISKRKFQGSGEKYINGSSRSKIMLVNFFYKMPKTFEHSNPYFQKSQKSIH